MSECGVVTLRREKEKAWLADGGFVMYAHRKGAIEIYKQIDPKTGTVTLFRPPMHLKRKHAEIQAIKPVDQVLVRMA